MSNNKHNFKGKNNPNYKTGFCIKGKTPSFYISWQGMKKRCFNKNNVKYSRYGGRGITVCDEWMTIEGFYKWVLISGWKQGDTIDRIDNNGNYCPENCRWISMSENSRKKSTTKLSFEQAKEIRIRVEKGEKETDLAREYGVVHGTIWFIVKNFTHVKNGECTKKLKNRINNSGNSK